MDNKAINYHISKIFSELEATIADRIIIGLKAQLAEANSLAVNEKLLKEFELCNLLQISTSHFYKLKKKYCKTFPVYSIDGAKRYKQSEVENFFKSLKQ